MRWRQEAETGGGDKRHSGIAGIGRKRRQEAETGDRRLEARGTGRKRRREVDRVSAPEQGSDERARRDLRLGELERAKHRG